MKYLEITGRIPLPDSHREAAGLTSKIDEVLTKAEREINVFDELGNFDFEFVAKQRAERPNLRGPRKNKTTEVE